MFVADSTNGLPPTIDLQEARLDLWSHDACKAADMWGDDIIENTHLCAGQSSGSPAVCNVSDMWGVISNTHLCTSAVCNVRQLVPSLA